MHPAQEKPRAFLEGVYAYLAMYGYNNQDIRKWSNPYPPDQFPVMHEDFAEGWQEAELLDREMNVE